MMQAARETEIKIRVVDHDQIRDALRLSGATLEHLMTRETNIVLDSKNGELQSSGSLLRLRRYGSRKTVTFKGPVSYEGVIKDRIEHETEVADFDQLLEVFASLGFTEVARYEKEREEWTRDGLAIVLDHTPMGDFVEIEGNPRRLLSTANMLNLDPAGGLLGSYLSLWATHRLEHPELELPTDMVFSE